ncbi:putative efflux protein, MATE family [Butyrivibrio sp. INlla18]|uniref:MATE family efflux transporter n=1 Tax=Butyrivibrio sp. INlla18 TaxID=1520806 RepID=UPI00088B532D|nr:MATE family efflux transporter [Butyrivibrio sp. INlla18]SDA37614.1 putative efflux protein, MATE family [Butyrivibrio sp. INlla18]
MPRSSESKTQNMTSGNSFKQIVLFFIPLLWGNLFQQVYSLVDSIIVGKGISDKALAAVGASGTLNFLILGFVVGMTRGFGILFAQCFGREDHAMLRAYISAAKRLCIGISLVLSVVCILALRSMLKFMQTPADIIDDAYIYFVIILIGIVITVLNNLVITILQSLGDSKTPLSAMIISSLANIVMDIFLVMGLGIGVAGAAIATVLAQLFSFIYCFYKIKMIDIFDKKNYSDAEVNGKNITFELVKIGIPVAFMNSITAAGGIILQYFVNLMGSGYVAAYSACMKFASLFEQFGMSAGLSMMTFVGQNMGAGKYDRIRKGVRQGLLLATVLNIPLASVQILFPEQLARIFLSDPEIISYCKDFLPILGISLFALGWLFVYRYSVQGLGNTFVPMLSGALEVIMRLTVCFTIGRASFRGIALSEVSAWIGAFIMLMITYYVVISSKNDQIS